MNKMAFDITHQIDPNSFQPVLTATVKINLEILERLGVLLSDTEMANIIGSEFLQALRAKAKELEQL